MVELGRIIMSYLDPEFLLFMVGCPVLHKNSVLPWVKAMIPLRPCDITIETFFYKINMKIKQNKCILKAATYETLASSGVPREVFNTAGGGGTREGGGQKTKRNKQKPHRANNPKTKAQNKTVSPCSSFHPEWYYLCNYNMLNRILDI